MEPNVQPAGMLPLSMPTVTLIVMAVLGLALWCVTHLLIRKSLPKWAGGPFFIVRVMVGWGAMLLVISAIGRFLLLATSWPMWVPALLAAAATETVLFLYLLERQTVRRRAGLALVALRLSIALLVAFMLMQPVFSRDYVQKTERYVAVLVDGSQSMNVADTQSSALEKLGLARIFSVDVGVPGFAASPQFDQMSKKLEEVRRSIEAQSNWLTLLGSADSGMFAQQLGRGRDAMRRILDTADKTVAEQLAVVSGALGAKVALPAETRVALEGLKNNLATQVCSPLKDIAAKTAAEPKPNELGALYNQLSAGFRQVNDALGKVLVVLPGIAVQMEEAYFASLSDAQQKRVDEAASKTRKAIARRILAAKMGGASSVLQKLEDKYLLKFYEFAAASFEVDAASLSEEGAQPVPNPPKEPKVPKEQPPVVPAGTSKPAQATDFAAALEKVLNDIPAGKLAGIVVISDGRHNAKTNLDQISGRLATQKTPVCSILVGSARPPIDAAIVNVDAPKTINVDDKLVVKVDMKLDGLKGKDVRVKLNFEGKTVDEKTVKVPLSDAFRTSVELADTPKKNGVRTYKLEVQAFEGEAFRDNNSRDVHVAVTDDRTKLFIVEGWPRWEYRYLKNLFADRDKTVQLQHFLMNPDRVDTAPKQPPIHASASRKPSEIEATALPKDLGEWLKFDVIILGDLHPDTLPEKEIKAIEKFVSERGGTLVVIAGSKYMSRAYTDQTFLKMLPMNFEFKEFKSGASPSPEPAFRLAMTAAGREHVVLRQSDNPEENRTVWEKMPELTWRHPLKELKPGATVLAFAMPVEIPNIFKPGSNVAGAKAEELTAQRRAFESKNAVIAIQRFGLGQVMMLGFDQTWRLRYRAGDERHHKFWCQVLRWANAGKLQAGTDLVRIGADEMQYNPDQPVKVRARITNVDHSPVVSEDVFAKVFDGPRLVLQKKLDRTPDSPGMYEADLGALPPGKRYRIELSGPEVEKILRAKGPDKVETEIVVVPTYSAELTELTADRTALDTLARVSNGAVADPQHAADVLDRLGSGIERKTVYRRYLIWNSWPLFLVMLVGLAAEWVLRKRVGLI